MSATWDGRGEERERADAISADAGIVPPALPAPPSVVPSSKEICDQYPWLPGCAPGGGSGGAPPPSFPDICAAYPDAPGCPGGPPAPGGIVTETACAAREEAAFDRGRAAERQSIVVPAVIGAVVTGVVGAFLGHLLGGGRS